MDDDDKKIRDLLNIFGNKTIFLSGPVVVAIIAMLILAIFFLTALQTSPRLMNTSARLKLNY